MKRLIQAGLLVPATLLCVGVQAYTAVETTALDADGIISLSIRTFSGPLSITRSTTGRIEAEEVIDFDDEWEDDEARDALAGGLVFRLDKRGTNAELASWVGDFDDDDDVSLFTWGLIDLFRDGKERPFSHLEVRAPDGIDLEIHDYRGEVIITRVTGDIELRTGAGPVQINTIEGDLTRSDGSGPIDIKGICGNVVVKDGSGEIEAREIGGHLSIDDGSGSILLDTVGRNLDIRDGPRALAVEGDVDIADGSGEITVIGVGGTITLSDGSGDMNVRDVGRHVVVRRGGSGQLNVRDNDGKVIDENRSRRFRDTAPRYRDVIAFRNMMVLKSLESSTTDEASSHD